MWHYSEYREASEKAFKFNFEGRKDIVARFNANSEARIEEDSKMEIKVRSLGEKGSFKYGFDQSWNCY